MNKKALRDLLTERRALIDPTGHGFQRPARQGRRAPGLSQHQVDQLCHRTLGTYRRLESGSYPNPPVDLLRDIAVLFALNEQEWVSLCRYAGIGDPPSPSPPLRQGGPRGVAGGRRRHDAHGLRDGRLVGTDRVQRPVHPPLPQRAGPGEHHAVDAPRPRRKEHPHRLGDRLGAPRTPQLRAALATRPDDEVLRRIEKEVAVDPACAPIWESGGAHIHPDGDERPLLHASDGPGWVTMCAAQPMTAPGARLIVLVFHPGARRAHSRVPVLHAP